MKHAITTLRMLTASQVAAQPVPHYVNLNYADLFKIQHVHNPFILRPVSYSALAGYLECPSCSLEQRRKRRPKEPKRFTSVRQPSLFSGGAPDPRLVGTLLHTLINLLHDPQGPLSSEQQNILLARPASLVDFLHNQALASLQAAGKLRLAMFFEELSLREERLHTLVINPLLHYQRELTATGSTILATSERFQFKLLSTRHTFAEHPDWGGHVALVGEFDQVRLRKTDPTSPTRGRPAIIEFKKGLTARKKKNDPLPGLFAHLTEEQPEDETISDKAQPNEFHAMQLMVYWLAFQTRWDVLECIKMHKGMLKDIRMSLHQELDLIIYNLNDSCQYRLCPPNPQEALLALTNCIFYLDWALKSGYAAQSADHECLKTSPLATPISHVQVGNTTLSSEECYLRARASFEQFKSTIQWETLPPR
ncbi:MAG: PD-(D/E)XK nuclease family protein [Ktedonobacteraceae bacterium]|nr:PD-(D/E)XK nuclease family protein [Ktedonobacteraceae bacterium]MBO0792929.1 PD-(D/E)XK nuclease family protein [Ktedonobacteraceae bacterium]